MSWRYLLLDDFGNVWGTNERNEALQRWKSGDFAVIDSVRKLTWEDDGGEAPREEPIPALVSQDEEPA